MTTDRTDWLVLASLTERGDRTLGDLVRSIGPAETLSRIVHDRHISTNLAQKARTRLAALGRPSGQPLSGIAEEMLEHADRLGARIITPADEEWPSSSTISRASPQTATPRCGTPIRRCACGCADRPVSMKPYSGRCRSSGRVP
ncbi:hypothetical protein [Dactylosporangium cerinum]